MRRVQLAPALFELVLLAAEQQLQPEFGVDGPPSPGPVLGLPQQREVGESVQRVPHLLFPESEPLGHLADAPALGPSGQ